MEMNKLNSPKLSFFTSNCSLIPSTSKMNNNKSLNQLKNSKLQLLTRQEKTHLSLAFIPTKNLLIRKENLKNKKVPIYKQKTNDAFPIKEEKLGALINYWGKSVFIYFLFFCSLKNPKKIFTIKLLHLIFRKEKR